MVLHSCPLQTIFVDEVFLGKGQPVRVFFGQDVKDKVRVVGVTTDQGKVLVNRKVINEGLTLLNDKDWRYIIIHAAGAAVAGGLWFHYRRRARREQEADDKLVA